MRIFIPNDNVLAPSSMGEARLTYGDNRQFAVELPGKNPVEIQRAFIPKEFRGLSLDQVQRVGDVGYFSLKAFQNTNGTPGYSLDFNQRLRGGGPFLAGIVGGLWLATGTVLAVFPPTTAVGVSMIATTSVVAGAAAVIPTP